MEKLSKKLIDIRVTIHFMNEQANTMRLELAILLRGNLNN